MITTLIFDFSKVILFSKDKTYTESLNKLHKNLCEAENYEFNHYFEFNEELLQYLQKVKDSYSLNIFTTGKIQEAPTAQEKIKTLFEIIVSAEDYQISKKQPKSYTFLLEILHKKPEEVIYIDDTIANIEAAKEAGLDVIHFQNTKQLFKELQNCIK